MHAPCSSLSHCHVPCSSLSLALCMPHAALSLSLSFPMQLSLSHCHVPCNSLSLTVHAPCSSLSHCHAPCSSLSLTVHAPCSSLSHCACPMQLSLSHYIFFDLFSTLHDWSLQARLAKMAPSYMVANLTPDNVLIACRHFEEQPHLDYMFLKT